MLLSLASTKATDAGKTAEALFKAPELGEPTPGLPPADVPGPKTLGTVLQLIFSKPERSPAEALSLNIDTPFAVMTLRDGRDITFAQPGVEPPSSRRAVLCDRPVLNTLAEHLKNKTVDNHPVRAPFDRWRHLWLKERNQDQSALKSAAEEPWTLRINSN